MLEFKEKKRVTTLTASDGDIEASIYEEKPWDRKKRKESDISVFRVTVNIKDDDSYNVIELACETEDEAKILAQDAVNFIKRNRPGLLVRKEELDSED